MYYVNQRQFSIKIKGPWSVLSHHFSWLLQEYRKRVAEVFGPTVSSAAKKVRWDSQIIFFVDFHKWQADPQAIERKLTHIAEESIEYIKNSAQQHL